MMTDVCKHCGLPEARHTEDMHHKFLAEGGTGVLAQRPKQAEPGARITANPEAPTVKQGIASIDLPLRVALMRAGIISPADLAKAEEDVSSGGVLLVVPGG